MGFFIEERIGWGSSSKVYRGRHKLTGQLVAIKIINKPRSRMGYIQLEMHFFPEPTYNRSGLQRTFGECAVLEKLKHPNVVEMDLWFETEKHVYIVLELAKDGMILEEEKRNWCIF